MVIRLARVKGSRFDVRSITRVYGVYLRLWRLGNPCVAPPLPYTEPYAQYARTQFGASFAALRLPGCTPNPHTSRCLMQAVVRSYAGASELIAEMTRKRQEIMRLLSSVPGFVSYHAVEAGDEMITVTICDDEAGTTESTRRAANWVKENLPDLSMKAPKITRGGVFIDF
jgi:hypothetical protein